MLLKPHYVTLYVSVLSYTRFITIATGLLNEKEIKYQRRNSMAELTTNLYCTFETLSRGCQLLIR